MKKGYLFLITLLIVGLLVGNVYKQNDMEFEIVNSYIVSADNFKSVTLQVIVNMRNYDEEEVLCKVKEFYCQNNGNIDTLRINLYDSKAHYEKSKCRVGKTF